MARGKQTADVSNIFQKMDHLQEDHLNQGGLPILYIIIGQIILTNHKPSNQLKNDAIFTSRISTMLQCKPRLGIQI